LQPPSSPQNLAPDLAAAVHEASLGAYPEESDLEVLRDALATAIASERAAAGLEGGKGRAELVDPGLAREAAR
jgi:hypothetical protein